MTLTFIKKLKGKYKGFRFNTVGVCEELASWIRSGGDVYIREDLEKNFLHLLLEDYLIMLNRDIECQQSEACIAENIEANEYEFLESGERA